MNVPISNLHNKIFIVPHIFESTLNCLWTIKLRNSEDDIDNYSAFILVIVNSQNSNWCSVLVSSNAAKLLPISDYFKPDYFWFGCIIKYSRKFHHFKNFHNEQSVNKKIRSAKKYKKLSSQVCGTSDLFSLSTSESSY